MKELLEFIAKSMVTDPESVQVEVVEKENLTVLKLHVAESDMGKVIGKQGRIAKAIRTVIKSAGSRENKKVVVDILQSKGYLVLRQPFNVLDILRLTRGGKYEHIRKNI